jgi:hypothetical protein
MQTRSVFLMGLACMLLPVIGHAQGIKAVRAIPGYRCMLLSPEDEQAPVQSELPPVLAAPSAMAPRIGYPSGIVFVKWPLHEVGGYTEMLRPNGETGWIATGHLRVWYPMNNTNATCTPSLMSNGRLGTDVR